MLYKKKFIRSVYISLYMLCFFLPHATQGNTDTLCISTKNFFTLRTQTSCRASFQKLFPWGNVRFCFSEEIWKSYLYGDKNQICFPFSALTKSDHDYVLYIKTENLTQLEESTTFSIFKSIDRFRNFLSQHLKPYDPSGMLRTLFLNEKGHEDAITILRKIGYVHLSSISGIHILILWGSIAWIIPRIGWPYSLTVLKFFAYNLWFISIFFLICLNGGRIGLARPLLHIALKKIFQYLGITLHQGIPLLLTFIIDILWITPPSMYHSMLTYYLAVGGAVWWQNTSPHDHTMLEHLRLSAASFFLVGCIQEILHHQWITLYTPLCNIISLPFILGFFPLLTLWFIGLAGITYGGHLTIDPISHWITQKICAATYTFIKLLIYVGKLPGNCWIVTTKTFLQAALGAALILLLPKKYQKILIGLGISLRLMYSILPPQQENALEINKILQLSVGQGDATILQQKQKYFMIDIGPQHGLSLNKWFLTFSENTMTHIEHIMFTHLDSDHIDGIHKVSSIIPIKNYFFDPSFLTHPKAQHYQKLFEKTQTTWAKPPIWHTTASLCANAIKANKTMTGYAALLPHHTLYLNLGDAPHKLEQKVFLPWIKSLKTSVGILKISHHGSCTSTHIDFLKQLQPEQAWISVKRFNRYRHPCSQVVQNLNTLRIPTYRTDLHGNLYSHKLYKKPRF